MSWKSIAGNQTVSRENLQNAVNTGVFVEKAPIPSGYATKQITKAEADSYIATWELYPPYRNKAPNQLPVKSDLAVQSNQIYATGTTPLYLGNTNRDWVFSILNAGEDEWGSVASATDNRCILAGKSYSPGSGGGSAYVSSDYGETWRRLDDVMTTNDAALGAAMNSYGDYMILTRQVGSFDGDRAKIYWSYNSGVNWAVGYQDGVRYNFNGAAMSGNGVYATVLGSDGTGYYVFRSTSFGSSFSKVYLCAGPKVLQGGCVAMSKSGQYQLLTPPLANSPDSGKCFLSTNWGETWTSFYLTVPPLLPWNTFYGCSISAGGDYMTISSYSSTSGNTATWISSDWGSSWTQIEGAEVAQAVDSSGQFQYQKNRKSVDYGNTWSGGVNANAISVNPTTFTKPYLYGIPYSVSYVWQSTNQGTSFTSLTNSPTGTLTYIVKSGGSYDGKYVGTIRNNNDGTYNLYTSSNYGASWINHFSTSGEELRLCAVSDNGQYWLAVGYIASNYSLYIYRSTDGGETWSYTYNSYIGTPVDCAISNDGKYMTIIYQGNGAGYSDNVINSSDYGANWVYSSAPPNPSGRIYNSIVMSGYGRFRAMLVSDDGLGACNIFYSGDYGISWSDKERITGFYGTCIAMDDTGKVGMAGVAKVDNSESRIYYTKESWNDLVVQYYDPFQIPMAYSPIITGVNVSSDATYWSAVSYNLPYSFVSINGGSVWTRNNLSYAINKLTK